MGDFPALGSGLGSSSAVTLGALHAVLALKGEIATVEYIARHACEIEIDRLENLLEFKISISQHLVVCVF